MLFMVVERFRGRMMPEGLRYVGSWVEADYGRCFQLVECEDPRLIGQWAAGWADLVEFEVSRVVTSEEAAEAIAPLL